MKVNRFLWGSQTDHAIRVRWPWAQGLHHDWVVQPGQSLNGIAKAITGPGASPQKIRETEAILVSANPQITNLNQLQPGQTVHVGGTAVDGAALARLQQAEGADQAWRAHLQDLQAEKLKAKLAGVGFPSSDEDRPDHGDPATPLQHDAEMRRILHGDFGSGPFGAWDLLDKLGDEFDRLGAFKPNSPLYDNAVRFLSHGGEVLRPILTSMNQFSQRFQIQGGIDMEGGNGEFASRVTTPRPGAAGFRDAEGIPAKKPTANPQEVSKTTEAVTQGGGKTAAANTKAPSHGAGYNVSQAAAGEKAGAGGVAEKTGTGFVRFSSNYVDHIISRDFNVPARRGIGGAHNLDEFSRYANEYRIVDTIGHPSVEGIQTIRYQMVAKNATGELTGSYRAPIFEKTVYDPEVISDETYRRQAAAEAQAAGPLNREWVGTAANGLKFRGYIDQTGAVKSFFPHF
ncbi:TPA: hypothetical protein DDW35_05650 [Candidatus Sumerlaeota bacterium]|nr:hypothetical protein [Candidatus Sumerlaeota bacterium]